MSPGEVPRTFQFGPSGQFVLDGPLQQLRRDGEPLRLQRKPMAVLRYLLENADRVVSGSELLDRIWPDVHVGPQALSAALRDVRRALGEHGHQLVETRRGHGYRFSGAIEDLALGAAAVVQAPSADPSAARPRFVGRESEMVRLRRLLGGPLAGRGCVSIVRGAAGIGKTRIAEELAAEAMDRGFSVHRGAGLSAQGAPPLWPFMEITRSCLESAAPPERATWLRAAGPALESWLPGGPRREVDPASRREGAQARFEIAQSLLRLLEAAARTAPRLCVLEDLHAVDPDSLAVLEIVANSVGDIPIVWLATLRDDPSFDTPELRRALGALSRAAAVERITLRGLGADAVRALMAADATEAPSADLLRRVCHVTDGNPLFVIEVARLHAAGRLSGTDAIPVPAVVREAIALQLDARSPECLEALRYAAVAGDSFAIETLRRVLDVSRDDLLDRLSEAESAGLVRETVDRPGVYHFRHALWREFLYESLTHADLRRAHLRTAEAIEAAYAPDLTPYLSALARHFLEAAPLVGAQKAAHYAQEAIERSGRIWALRDAADHCALALRALELSPEPAARRRCELHMLRGELLKLSASRTETAEESRAEFDAAADLAQRAALPDLLTHAVVRKAQVDLEPFLVFPGMRAPREKLAAVESQIVGAIEGLAHDDLSSRGRLLTWLARTRFLDDDLRGADGFIDEAEKTAETTGDTVLLHEVLSARWLHRHAPDELPVRHAIARRLRDLPACAELLPRDRLRFSLFAYAESGDLETADQLTRDIARLSRWEHPEVWMWRTLRATICGRFREAEDLIARTRRMDGYLVLFASAVQEMWLRTLQGNVESYLPLLRAARDDLAGAPLARAMLARCLAETGECDQARTEMKGLFERGLDTIPFDHHWTCTLALAAETVHLIGAPEHASSLYDHLLPFEEHFAMASWILLCMGSVSRPLGLLAALERDWARAISHLERALSTHERIGAIPYCAQSQLDLAKVLAARGRRADAGRANALARAASETAERIGMARLERQARSQLDRLGAR